MGRERGCLWVHLDTKLANWLDLCRGRIRKLVVGQRCGSSGSRELVPVEPPRPQVSGASLTAAGQWLPGRPCLCIAGAQSSGGGPDAQNHGERGGPRH